MVLLWAASQSGSRITGGVRQKEAQVICVSLRNATQQFLADYGKLPLPVSADPATGGLDTDSGVMPGLMAVLHGKEPPGTAPQNPRGTDYLNGIKPANSGKKPGGPLWINGVTMGPGLSKCSVVDSWGNFFRVRLDTDGDGLVENPIPDEVPEGRPRLKQRVIIWSPGKDGNDETWEDNPKSWE